MKRIEYNKENLEIKISNLNGEFFNGHSPFDNQKENEFQWQYNRIKNNNMYTLGINSPKINRSSNNLIISSNPNLVINNVKNSFINIGKTDIFISPIKEIYLIMNIIKNELNGNIFYNKPTSIKKRENLSEKESSMIQKQICSLWKIDAVKVSPMTEGRANNGIYLIEDSLKNKFVLKYRGRNKEKAELQSSFLNQIPKYFTRNKKRKDVPEYTFEINGELYGLENYIENKNPKTRSLEYLSLLGKNIPEIHKKFNYLLSENDSYSEAFDFSDAFINESNMISFYIDAICNKKTPKKASIKIKEIICSSFFKKMEKLPISLIHGDLNHSNIMWKGFNPIIIDSEAIKFSKRINEFVSPLLFERNMTKPVYLNQGMKKIIESFNQNSNNPISNSEKNVLPDILKYSLLKNYIIRSIRRGFDEDFSETEKNLKKLEENFNHEQ